jgi:hypothetical protein
MQRALPWIDLSRFGMAASAFQRVLLNPDASEGRVGSNARCGHRLSANRAGRAGWSLRSFVQLSLQLAHALFQCTQPVWRFRNRLPFRPAV